MQTAINTHSTLKIIDWVYRTGWRTRANDEALALWVFEDWLEATKEAVRRGERRDRTALSEALQTVFQDIHDAEGVENLCSLFHILFDTQIASRDWAAS